MKKVLLLILLIFGFALAGCTLPNSDVDCEENPTHEDCLPECDEGYVLDDSTCVFDDSMLGDYLDIYYVNDLHGGLLPDSDQIGISYIANLVTTRKEQSPDNVLFIAGGDMLQGSAISNYYYGLSTINILNESQLDAFVIGNHEFDWGLNTVLQYADGDVSNGEGNYPFLGANLFEGFDDTIPDNIEPYTIIEKGDHKIGIIGTLEYGIEYAIAQSRIDGYHIGDPIPEIEYYAKYLRRSEDCDVIIVASHDRGLINYEVSLFDDDSAVDAVFNGHSKQSFAVYENEMPTMHSGEKGEYVSHLRITFEEDGTRTYTMNNLGKYDNALLMTPYEQVETLLETYIAETDVIFSDVIITNDEDISSYELTAWMAKLMRLSTNADIAFHNYGGTRTGLEEGQDITLGVLYDIWPFDNVVKTVELKGSVITSLLSASSMAYSTTVDTFEPDTYYVVATNDYVFDKTNSPYLNGENQYNTGVMLRGLVESELQRQSELYSAFSVDNDILTNSLATIPRFYLQKED